MSTSIAKVPTTCTEEDILAAVEAALDRTAVAAMPLEGGMIGDVRRVTMADGAVLVSKYSNGPGARFDIEARMIEHLHRPGVVPIPRVIHATPSLLLQEYMPGEHMTAAAGTHAGELLARLHAIRGDAHGFAGETLNGSFLLPNGWWESWIACFRETRLRHCADAAVANGTLPAHTRARIQVLQDRLDDLLVEPEFPALMHGDIWGSNVLAEGDRVTALIDPSTHYGHPELEIAYAVEIGGFGQDFVRAYTRHHPLDDGFWSTRISVYATYSAIMHVYYFGARFEPLLDRMLTKSGV